MDSQDKVAWAYVADYDYFLSVAYRIVGDRELARDIVQDGFVRILGSSVELQDTGHARRYLTGCVKNAAFERLRGKARTRAMRRDFVEDHQVQWAERVIESISCPTVRAIMAAIYLKGDSRRKVALEYRVSRPFIAAKERAGLKGLKPVIATLLQK